MLERLGLRRKVEGQKTNKILPSSQAAASESLSDFLRRAAEEGVRQGLLNLSEYDAMLGVAREIERQSSSAKNS